MEIMPEEIRSMQNTQKLDLICDACGEKTYKRYDGGMILPRNCKCDRDRLVELKKEDEREKLLDQQRRLNKIRQYSMMDGQFEQCTFENFKVDEDNRKVYEFSKKYCEKWDDMYKNNIGIMFHGKQGIGKSFISFCIANELIRRYIPVVAISTIALLERIKQSYNRYGDEGELQIISQLKNASLLILDDIGAENNTPWVKEKLYEIIDSRDRQGKPLIITTNLTKEQLQNKLTGSDAVNRTYDRIVKMCQAIECVGVSKRTEESLRKAKVLREILAG
jgi:DNA replication protein DnaC